MEATNILMSEHRVIEGVLAALDEAARRLEQGQPVRTGFFLDAAEFIKEFADGCHHRKEEGVLFESMIAHGMSPLGGPIAVMLADHEQGRSFTRNLREAARQLEAGGDAAKVATEKAAIISNARGYTTLLRQHIMKEDNILYPMADRIIPPVEQPALVQDFERVERDEKGENVHEKYLALAVKLEKEMGLK